MKLFLILSLHFLLLSFLSEAKTKANIVDIYKAKAEYEKLALEAEAVADKHGENSSKYKKISKKADAKYNEFYKKATVEYWKTIRTQAEIKEHKAMTRLEQASSALEKCNASTEAYASLYEQQKATTNIAFITSDELATDYTKLFDELAADYTKLFNKFYYSDYNSKILPTQSKADHKKTVKCSSKIKKPDLQACLKKDQNEFLFRRTCVAQMYFDTCGDFMKCLKKNNWQNKKPESLHIMHKQCLFNRFVHFLDPYNSAFESVDKLYKDAKTKRQVSSKPTTN